MELIDVGYARPTGPDRSGNLRYLRPARLTMAPSEAVAALGFLTLVEDPNNPTVRALWTRIKAADGRPVRMSGDLALQAFQAVASAAEDILAYPNGGVLPLSDRSIQLARQIMSVTQVSVAGPDSAVKDLTTYNLEGLDDELDYTIGSDARITGGGDPEDWPEQPAYPQAA